MVSAPILLSFSSISMHISARSLTCCSSRLSVVISGIVTGCLLCPRKLSRRPSSGCRCAAHAFNTPRLQTQAPPAGAAGPIVRAGARARHMSAGQSRAGPHLTSQSRGGATPGLRRAGSPGGARRGLHVEAQVLPLRHSRPSTDRRGTCRAPLETVGGSGGALEDVAGRAQNRRGAPTCGFCALTRKSGVGH